MNVFRIEFDTELRSLKSDKWFLKKEIIYELSTSHSQKQNKVFEKIRKIIINMIRCIIIRSNISDYLWTEVVLIMIHVKNVRFTKALEENTLFETYESKSSSLNHLKILESTMYVFIHEAERVDANNKSIKFSSRAQKETLCEYDEKIIYRVFLKKNYKMIRAKDLRIYENVNAKEHTELFAYDAIMKETDVSLLSNKSNDIIVVKRSRERSRKNANLT